VSFAFVKGHGTGNDFVVLPDLDGSLQKDLDAALVARLCDRRRGIGADGVLRVLPGSEAAPWFMDYRNADGSVSQMCGNGVRVFVRYLVEAGLVDPAALHGPLVVGTRDGDKPVTFCADGETSVDMGAATVGGPVELSSDGRRYEARRVDLGNPHAVAIVDDLDKVGDLRSSPYFCGVEFPDGVNVEFVTRRGPTELAMRVFERGVGETLSCGTGACAVVAATLADESEGAASPAPVASRYTVEVPGGTLTVTADTRGHLHLKGPAVLVANGTWLG
jgi:diaminopimelate epimerase